MFAELLVILAIIVAGVLIFAWIRKSKWFDKFCKSLESKPYPDEASAKERMYQINQEKQNLLKHADINIKAIEALNKEKDEINKFLGLKGDDNAIDEDVEK